VPHAFLVNIGLNVLLWDSCKLPFKTRHVENRTIFMESGTWDPDVFMGTRPRCHKPDTELL
jgi:hypothetical protein